MEALAIGPGMRKRVLAPGGATGAVPARYGYSVQLRYAVSDAAAGAEAATDLAAAWPAAGAAAFALTLGQGDGLPCVEAAVLTMALGEVAQFILADEAACQLLQLAAEPLASEETLALTIELLSAAPPPRLDLPTATTHKEAGNAAFKAKDYTLAVQEYMRAVDVVERRQPSTAGGVGGDLGHMLMMSDTDTHAASALTDEEAVAMAALRLDALNNLSLVRF